MRGESGWVEAGDGVFVRRYQSLNLNIGLVLGAEGALLIDTRASHRQAQELISHLTEVTTVPIRWVVNTHWHWDHTFGNALFPVERWGHERCRRRLLEDGEAARQEARAWLGPEGGAELDEVEITPPQNTLTERVVLDLGDRGAHLTFLGLGHTDHDVVVAVPGVGVVFAGDLVEEGGAPYFGESYPLDWPETLLRLEEDRPETVVPGHGQLVDRAFVARQREAISRVAALARQGHAAGTPWRDLVGEGPFPEETMAKALARAYWQLSAG